MTTSTARYRFEYRLHEWAEDLSMRMCGEMRSLFVGVRASGAVRRIYFSRTPSPFDGDRKRLLADGHQHWFLYQTHGERGSGYIEWFELDRGVVERWLGGAMADEDMADVRGAGELSEWPACWRVLMG